MSDTVSVGGRPALIPKASSGSTLRRSVRRSFPPGYAGAVRRTQAKIRVASTAVIWVSDQYPGVAVETVTPQTERRWRRIASPPSALYSRCAAALSLLRTMAAMSARSAAVTARPSACTTRR